MSLIMAWLFFTASCVAVVLGDWGAALFALAGFIYALPGGNHVPEETP